MTLAVHEAPGAVLACSVGYAPYGMLLGETHAMSGKWPGDPLGGAGAGGYRDRRPASLAKLNRQDRVQLDGVGSDTALAQQEVEEPDRRQCVRAHSGDSCTGAGDTWS